MRGRQGRAKAGDAEGTWQRSRGASALGRLRKHLCREEKPPAPGQRPQLRSLSLACRYPDLEKGDPAVLREARQRSQRQLGRKKSEVLTYGRPRPQFRGCSEPQKVCALQARTARPLPAPAGAGVLSAHPASPARAGCPLKVTADKAPASPRGEWTRDAPARALAGQRFPGTRARESQPGGRERPKERGGGPEPRARPPPASPAPAPRARCCRCRCRWCAPGPARPRCGCGSSAAAAPALASPRPPRRRPPTPAAVASAAAALRSARLLPLSLPSAPSSPTRSPSALPKLRTESALQAGLAVQPALPPGARCGSPGAGVRPLPGLGRWYSHQHQLLTAPRPSA